MRYNPVNIVVPAYNDAGVLDATLDSVAAQEYGGKIFLFIVDFGSTDGTLEKAAARREEQTAVFCLAGRRVGRTMAADAVRATREQAMGARTLLLWPGDVIYPHCLRTAEKWLRKRSAGMLIAEADIRDGKGNVRVQAPLFTKPGYIRGFSRDSSEYVRRGWRHAVLRYGGGYSPAHGKVATQQNFDHWWNAFAYKGLFTNVVYVNAPLGCLRERRYADELDEIVFRFEMGLTLIRASREVPDGHVVDERFEPLYRLQLATYALWRAFLLVETGEGKAAEDCFLMARVIRPAIAGEECWLRLERLLEHGGEGDRLWLRDWFAREEPADAPKWPIGKWDMATRLWQQVWQFASWEKISSWGRS